MEIYIKVILKIIREKGKEYINIIIMIFMKEIGKIIYQMEKGNSLMIRVIYYHMKEILEMEIILVLVK